MKAEKKTTSDNSPEADSESHRETVRVCVWCGEAWVASDCEFEHDLGWLCHRCQHAICSRGEQVVIERNRH